ncbi:hypothetical protein TWF281_011335 [Arthrobotrys megalospora]
MKDSHPAPPPPAPTPLDLDTKSFVNLSEFSPTAFSPTSEGTSTDGLLTTSLLPTLSNTFVFPDPANDEAVSMAGTAPSSVCSRATRGSGSLRYERYPGYEWGRRSFGRSLEGGFCGSSLKSEKRYFGNCSGDMRAPAAPVVSSTLIDTTSVSQSRILNLLLLPSRIPDTQPTSTDLLLGSIYVASALRLLLQAAAAVNVVLDIVPSLSTDTTIFLSILCITTLTAWFASAGRSMKDGWASWGFAVSFRFLVAMAGLYTLWELGSFAVAFISLPSYDNGGEIDTIIVTLPNYLERRHILDLLVKLQSHLRDYIGMVEQDMISYVNGKIQSGQADERVMERLQRVYAGLVAITELDGQVLGEVLKGLWGGV